MNKRLFNINELSEYRQGSDKLTQALLDKVVHRLTAWGGAFF